MGLSDGGWFERAPLGRDRSGVPALRLRDPAPLGRARRRVPASRLRDPSTAITTATPPAAPANANAATAPALCTNPPATAAPSASPVMAAVSPHEKASVFVPGGANRSTIA